MPGIPLGRAKVHIGPEPAMVDQSAAAIFGDDHVRRFQIAMITPAEWAAASASAISAAYFIVSFKGRPPLFARSKVVPATYSTAMKQTSCSSKMS